MSTSAGSTEICAGCNAFVIRPRCSLFLSDRLFTPLTPTAKATDENLASEDWDTNLQICDKVGDEGSNGCV